MNHTTLLLLLSTAPVGIVHTLLGPDHYLPFIALSKSRNWSLGKTAVITALCGIGHILSAAVLGIAAVSAGSVLTRLDFIEGARGQIAAWLLIAFGFVYFVWGLRSAVKNRTHTHRHIHHDEPAHSHEHSHAHAHAHIHEGSSPRELTPWVLFVIFILGPCEPLIPLIMYPAAQNSLATVVLVTLVFGMSTLAAMLTVVISSSFGLKRLARFPFFERYGNALSGGIICSCGMAIAFLGL